MLRSKISGEANFDEAELLRIMHVQNPWWDSGEVSPVLAPTFKRRDYHKLVEKLPDRKVVAVLGARRVGKTTLMYQLIERIIQQSDPSCVLYISFDNPYLSVNVESLNTILDLYGEKILKQPLSELKEVVHVFLDEVQTLVGWDTVLKRWYDLGYKLKFFASSSSNVNIMRGGVGSLVGRIRPQIVSPMMFLENLHFHMGDEEVEWRLNDVNSALRDSLTSAVQNNNVNIFFSAVKESANTLAKDTDRILILLHDYLLKGGYPGVVSTKNLGKVDDILQSYLSLTIYKDIVKIFKIRDPIAFEDLVSLIAKESCNRVNYSNLAKILGLKRDTLKSYISYLKSAFLVSESEFYSQDPGKRTRRDKKAFYNDPGIRSVSIGALNEYLHRNPVELGKVVQTVVTDHCRRLIFNLEGKIDPPLFYWKNQAHEIDIVMELFRKTLPIEVKYSQTINEKDLRSLQTFSKKLTPPFSIVVTRTRLDLSENIIFVPLWLFLLMC